MKQKLNKNRRKSWLGMLLLPILIYVFFAYSASAHSNSKEGIRSKNVILLSLDDHKIIYSKNSEDIVYPASLTKMMTSIIAIETLADLNVKIRLDGEIFQELYRENAALAGFQPGEEVRAIDLLYGAMLPSGAESCVGLAEYIAGSEEEFAQLMNQKAQELGLKHTNFVNATGLHDDQHYSTVEDLSKILLYGLENETFRTIFTSNRYTTSATNLHDGGITCVSTLFERLDNNPLTNGAILGGKTGYTSDAGLCLASLAQIDGKEYILVTTGAKGNKRTEQFHITDAIFLYNSLGGSSWH